MYNFSKTERLCSKILTTELFSKGHSFYEKPLKCIWLETEIPQSDSCAQILISIPKKNIKNAVLRNKLKRRLREAYRLNKKEFIDTLKNTKKSCILAIVFTDKQSSDFHTLQNKIILILHRLSKELEN